MPALLLVQEYYAHDVWQLLVCCVLMSRVSSWETKHRVIAAFFEKYASTRVMISIGHVKNSRDFPIASSAAQHYDCVY